jgi:medium-chain acyl-[acyl-carrier-protein] hydrolase
MNPWIVRPRARPEAALRLLCFPFAGSGASAFRTWPDALPGEVELWAIELPGRERRMREPLFDRIGPLVSAIVDGIAPELDRPFAIYGHSLGSMLGFSVARELRRRGLPAPHLLVVSGRRAPHLSEPEPWHQLTERQLQDRLRRLGGIPEAVFAEPEIMEVFMPILRADIAVSEAEPAPPEPPLDTPITALGGASDERATPEQLAAWGAHSSAGFDHELFPGGHFFIQTARDAVLASLSRRLSAITARL